MLNVVAIVVAIAQAQSPCRDLRVSLPESRPDESPRSTRFASDSARYLLSALFEAPSEPGEAMVIPCGTRAHDVGLRTVQSDGSIDLPLLRELIDAAYLESRAGRNGVEIPDSLVDLRKALRYEEWPRTVVEQSSVKALTRVIYDSPPGLGFDMSVAETRDSRTGDLEAPLMETELLVKRARSEDWDFYAYSKSGKLSVTSEFRGRTLPSPVVCMGCHYNLGTRSFRPRMR